MFLKWFVRHGTVQCRSVDGYHAWSEL